VSQAGYGPGFTLPGPSNIAGGIHFGNDSWTTQITKLGQACFNLFFVAVGEIGFAQSHYNGYDFVQS